MTSKVHAWDAVWNAVEDSGVCRPYNDPRGEYLPIIGENGVSYGQRVVDCAEALRATRLTTQQILAIAELIRAVARAVVHSNNEP